MRPAHCTNGLEAGPNAMRNRTSKRALRAFASARLALCVVGRVPSEWLRSPVAALPATGATLLTLIAYANLATTIVAVEKHACSTPARRWLAGIAVAVLELLAVIALTRGFLLIPNLDQAQQLARFATEMAALLAALALKVRALTTSRQRP